MIGGGIFIQPIGAKGGWYATAITFITGVFDYVVSMRRRRG